MTPLHPADSRYIERHAAYYDEFADLEGVSPEWRIEIEARQGRVTHHSRCRIKSTAYDWQRLNAWMTKHRMTNESMVLIY